MQVKDAVRHCPRESGYHMRVIHDRGEQHKGAPVDAVVREAQGWLVLKAQPAEIRLFLRGQLATGRMQELHSGSLREGHGLTLWPAALGQEVDGRRPRVADHAIGCTPLRIHEQDMNG
jgi:hypothetical protein